MLTSPNFRTIYGIVCRDLEDLKLTRRQGVLQHLLGIHDCCCTEENVGGEREEKKFGK